MNPHGTRVLCVEDDEDTGEMISSLLSLISCEVTIATTYDEALPLIEEQQFDLYFLDNWLPGGSGIELCRKIRATDPRTPIVFYSGASYDTDRQEALDAGAQAYLIKPAEVAKLVETVAELLARRKGAP